MKKWIYAVMSLTLSILLLSCTADRRPTRATAPATVAAATAGAAGKLETFNLVGTEWQLEDLAGSGVVEGGRRRRVGMAVLRPRAQPALSRDVESRPMERGPASGRQQVERGDHRARP